MKSTFVSNKARIVEIIAVIITALGKLFFMNYLNWKLPFIISAILFWTCYVIYRSKAKPGILKYWGFRTDNFQKVAKVILPFGILSLAIFLAIGLYQDTIKVTWHIIPILILYPVWGIIQQFLLIALVVGNLQEYNNSNFTKCLIVILPALLFGLVHYPFGWLILSTFILAIFYAIIYLKERNLYALGIFHGWLGGFFFYTVMDRDPFIEIFGGIIHISK